MNNFQCSKFLIIIQKNLEICAAVDGSETHLLLLQYLLKATLCTIYIKVAFDRYIVDSDFGVICCDSNSNLSAAVVGFLKKSN